MIRGKTVDGELVYSGEEVFKLMDSHGVDVRDKVVFDIEEFVVSAIKSGNFDGLSIYKRLKKDDEVFNWKLRHIIRRVYRDG